MEYAASAHAAGHKPTTLYLVNWTVHGRSCENVNIEEPTSRLSLTAPNCLRTSSNFLLCCSVLVLLASEEQQTAKRQNAISFIFSVSAAGTRSPKDAFRKIYWKCRQLCRLPFYSYPWGHRKTACRELESCRNWCLWVMKFSFPLAVTTTWFESGVKRRVRGAYRCKCVNVNLFECTRKLQEDGTSHFHFESVEPQLYRVIGSFRRCGIDNLIAFTASWPPTRTYKACGNNRKPF